MTDDELAKIEARHATRKASWENYGALHPLDDGPVIDDTEDLIAALKAERATKASYGSMLDDMQKEHQQ